MMSQPGYGMAQGQRIMIMAGGTGGHVFPALAVADFLREEGALVTWLGTRKGIESKLVPERGYAIDFIPVRPLRGTKGYKAKFDSVMRMIQALWESIRVMWHRRPSVVLGLGGFASGPGGIAAWLFRIPLLVHEQNAIPGTTNRILVRFATQVMEAFPHTFDPRLRALQTGNPVRKEITTLPVPELRFGQRRGRIRLLVLGGSQGAQAINEVLPKSLARLATEVRPEVWHQAGKLNVEETRNLYAEAGVEGRVDAFINDMAKAYEWADFVICRAGAMTISELTAAGLGSILIPYPHAIDDHQTRNAKHLRKVKAAVLVKQSDLTNGILAKQLEELLKDGRKKLLKMAQAARRLARADATRIVATTCVEAIRG